MKQKSKYSKIKQTKRICCQENVSQGIIKESSLNKMGIKENLQYQEEKRTW